MRPRGAESVRAWPPSWPAAGLARGCASADDVAAARVPWKRRAPLAPATGGVLESDQSEWRTYLSDGSPGAPFSAAWARSVPARRFRDF